MRLSATPSRDAADYPFHHEVRARFVETDAMGIVHHAAYLPWLEEARIASLRAIDRPYLAIRDEGIDFTVLEAFVQYRRPVCFDDVVTIGVRLEPTSRTTFQIAYLLRSGGEVRATAVTVHGAVGREGRPRRLPAWISGAVTHDRVTSL